MTWMAAIGLEVHVRLDTGRKLFCPCSTRDDAPPNADTCPVCRGEPGAMPQLHLGAVVLGLRAALALGAQVQSTARFHRKHYHYPDLPKGFQITQQPEPLALGGTLHAEVDGARRGWRLEQLHTEEDAGRFEGDQLDDNRAGAPLLEITTTPTLHTPEDVHAALTHLHRTLVEASVTRGHLQHGHFRADVNVSVAREGEPLGTRVELKNLGSFRDAKQAVAFEIARQTERLAAGDTVSPETRTWRDGQTVPTRAKESDPDYRYLPEPDLPPVVVTPDMLRRAAGDLALPYDLALLDADARQFEELVLTHGLPEDKARALTHRPQLLVWFQEAMSEGADAEPAANWLLGPIQTLRQTHGDDHLDGTVLARVLARLTDGSWHRDSALAVMTHIAETGASLADAAAAVGADEASIDLTDAIAEVLTAHPAEVARYASGERKLLGWFVAQVRASVPSNADPRAIVDALKAALDDAGGYTPRVPRET